MQGATRAGSSISAYTSSGAASTSNAFSILMIETLADRAPRPAPPNGSGLGSGLLGGAAPLGRRLLGLRLVQGCLQGGQQVGRGRLLGRLDLLHVLAGMLLLDQVEQPLAVLILV